MKHYADVHDIEISGDQYIGANWTRKKKDWALGFEFEWWIAPNDPKLKEKTRFEIVTFRTVGQWWYIKWRVSFPPGFDKANLEFPQYFLETKALARAMPPFADADEVEALWLSKTKAELAFISKNFYQSSSNYQEPMAVAKTLQTIEGTFQKLLVVFEKAKFQKQAASEAHSIAFADLEMLAKMHKVKINPEEEGVRVETLDGRTWLVSFHKHREVRFTADFDLAKAFRRFPGAFAVNGEKGTISISVDTVRELQKDKRTAAALTKHGIYIDESERFRVLNPKEEEAETETTP